MQTITIIFLTVGVATANAQHLDYTQPTKPTEAVRQQLIAKMQEFTQAWTRSDTASLSALLAEEYRHSDVVGKIQHRQEWLEFAATPRRELSDIKIDDVEIILYGNIAVITGRMPTFTLRFTQLWINRDGHWKRAAFQGTNIEQSK